MKYFTLLLFFFILNTVEVNSQHQYCCMIEQNTVNQNSGNAELYIKNDKFVFYNNEIVPEPLKIEVASSFSIDSIYINNISDYCASQGVSLTFKDDGVNMDEIANDNIYTSDKAICFANPSVEEYRQSGLFIQPNVHYTNGASETYFLVLGFGTINQNLFEIDTTNQWIDELSPNIYYSENLMNIVRDRTYNQSNIDYENLDIRDTINSYWQGYQDYPLMFSSIYEMNDFGNTFFFYQSQFNLLKVSGNLSPNNINHELNHIWVRSNSNTTLGFQNNGAHWGHIQRPSSGFGNGCFAGIFENIFIENDTVKYVKNNDRTFNDVEMCLMGLIPIDSVQFPIKYVSGVNSCNNQGYFDEGEVNYMSQVEFSNNFSNLNLEQQIEDTLHLKTVIFSDRKLSKLEHLFYDFYMKEYAKYFKNATNNLGIIDVSFRRLFVDEDGDGFISNIDCDDNNPDVNPDATETTYNGIDDDCDPTTLDDDLDQDGFALADDCDDTNAFTNPNATEIPDNGIDEDCDGEDLTTTSTHQLGEETIKIFPNPVSDILRLDYPSHLKLNIRLLSISGQEIMVLKNATAIDMSALENSAYLLEVTDVETGKKIIEKIISSK